MLEGIVAALAANPGPGLRAADAVLEDIWTYERAEGRRLLVPYDIDQPGPWPEATVQIDIVFDEALAVDPVEVALTPSGARLRAAPPELQLAWKILWLTTDGFPQGKDLYDAVLLAEAVDVPWPLLAEVLRPERRADADAFTAEKILDLDVDWDNHLAGSPGTAGTQRDWLDRLAIALHRSERATKPA
ncbi:nucleotidyl transferase AbiEii/AbiGii toxin family protein [Antribacter gilvus]|uniref:nucleotidyl transferase AbiEii/AbiGii toxin family protein n=1 Tax=Antribacter gilvus TaxID=2304675 RepID=UPI0013DEFDCE|nr:nucleotidyl transferase AbiEii/AbiGii toxin family protein [Antribacter gilvus]